MKEFNNDYGEYFSALERQLEKEKANAQTKNIREPVRVKKPLKKKKRKKPFLIFCLVVLAVILCVALIFGKGGKGKSQKPAENKVKTEQKEPKKNLIATADQNTKAVGDDIKSESVIVIDGTNNKIIAQRNADQRMYPASTTKIMTALVACENAKDLKKTFTMTRQITDPLYRENATVAGFSAGEEITVKDMLYGTVLPSGGDAAMGLAQTLFGSEEEFVNKMNKKAKELGLKNTNFANVTGLHAENHYTTVSDMAVILRAACENPLLKEILSTYQYTTSPTNEHPDGILLTSTLFSYMYGTEPTGGDILGGKTGFTGEAGYCIAAFGKSNSGNDIFSVIFKAPSKWPGIYDQINIFSQFCS